MNALVTGANGFLGRAVVAELLRRGHQVRALVRPAAQCSGLEWRNDVEMFRADLRSDRNLVNAFEGMDALLHLAACVRGDDETRFRSTVVGTENLLDAMAQSKTRRLVLASSFSVYDWRSVGRTLTEDSPIEGRAVYHRDGYAVAKVWQERVVRDRSRRHGWDLTVLRPAAIWGRGSEYLPNTGVPLGRVHVVIGTWCSLALTYVENCADAFVAATERSDAIGATFNVVDEHRVSPWKFTGEYLARTRESGVRILVPYHLGLAAVTVTHRVARMILGKNCRVPSVFVPCRFKARFRPVRCNDQRLRQGLNWTPPYTFEEALERTYGDCREAESVAPVAQQGQQCLSR